MSPHSKRSSKLETLKPTQKSQRDRFIETARALGCDEDEGAFQTNLREIARQKLKNAPVTDGPKVEA